MVEKAPEQKKTEFLNKLATASKKIKQIRNEVIKQNQDSLMRVYEHDKPILILEKIFTKNDELDKHLIKYLRYNLRNKKNINYGNIEYWVYRSAIASLSKYINRHLQMFFTQHYGSAYDMLVEETKNLSHDSKIEWKKAKALLKNIENNTYKDVGFIGDEEYDDQASDLISKTFNNIYERASYSNMSIDSLFDIVSIEIVRSMISEIEWFN